MQACSYTHGFASAVLAIALACAGCQSSSTKPAETASAEPSSSESSAGETAGESAATGESTAPASSGNAEKWEGEAEATASAPAAKAEAGETRTTAAIRQVIIDNRKPFRDCYEKAVKELPTLRGTMTLHFVLDPDGKVKQAELNNDRSDLKSPQVVDCSLALLKKLKFPESSRGMDTTVNYPFDFKN